MQIKLFFKALLCGALIAGSAGVHAERLKDLASIGGVRQNRQVDAISRGGICPSTMRAGG